MAFELAVPHSTDAADARARLEALASYLGNKYGLEIRWTGENTASVSGSYLVVSISGTIELTPGEVRFSGKDPGMLWRGKAKDYLKRKITTYLDPATSVSELPRG